MTDLFPDLPPAFSLERQIEALERELKFRGRVFPRRVADGKMSQEQMHEEIGAMQAALETLRAQRWREAKLEKPKEGETYLVWTEGLPVWLRRFIGGKWEGSTPTHWRPRPAPPGRPPA
jgi:hypothetical protein